MAIFGNSRARPVPWLNTGLSEARRVGRLYGKNVKALATGFLVDGGLFGKQFDALPFFLTCNYCLASKIQPKLAAITLLWSDGAVAFQQMQVDGGAKGEAAFLQILAESPLEKLDYSLLLLDRWPGNVPEVTLADKSPQPNDQVFIIGHPRGGGLAVTLEDNYVVPAENGAEPIYSAAPNLPLKNRIYYRAPTEGGSGGSPVYNEHWELVAMHEKALRNANCGVLMKAIVADAKRKLRGFKLPDNIKDSISQPKKGMPQVLVESPEYFSVFISYAHKDGLFADRLYHALESKGIRTWRDVKKMVPGENISEAVQRAIYEHDKILLCCSKTSLESMWVKLEIESTFEKEKKLSKKGQKARVLIPIILDGYFNKWKDVKGTEIRERLGADFRDWKDEKKFEASFDSLLQALRAKNRAEEKE